MSMIHVEESRIIEAHPEEIHAVVSDYRVGHPAILPKPYFTGLTVEKGGKGAGTTLRVQMKVYGQAFHYHQIVSEPEPGRVLVEAGIESSEVTTFTFEPLNSGQQTRVTIATDFPASPGIKGWMEKLVQPSVTRRIYRQELENLAKYVQSKKLQ